MSARYSAPLALALILGLGSSSVSGNQSAVPRVETAPQQSASLRFGRTPQQDPYRKLFPTAPLDALRSAEADAEAAGARRMPKVVCGTTLIPADAGVDPRIRVGKPRASTRYTINAVEPPLCRDK